MTIDKIKRRLEVDEHTETLDADEAGALELGAGDGIDALRYLWRQMVHPVPDHAAPEEEAVVHRVVQHLRLAVFGRSQLAHALERA